MIGQTAARRASSPAPILHAILTHLDHDLASCTPRFEVSQGFVGSFEREYPIHDLPDDARFNEGCDFAQLLAVRSHEKKRVPPVVMRPRKSLNLSHFGVRGPRH
jgi:hypothetical protein